jgi:hypothetical protein
LVEQLYSEVEGLELSNRAKNAIVMLMVAKTMKHNGRVVTFQLPVEMMRASAAA